MLLPHSDHLAAPLLVDLHPSNVLLLRDNLVLHPVLLFHFEVHVSLLLVVLFTDDLGLLGFLALGKVDGFLHFSFFVLALLIQHVIVLRLLSLVVYLHLVPVRFLKIQSKVLTSR